MNRKTTPQEKKIKDYENQRRNAYGGNDKNSRNAIKKRKRWVNKAYRKRVNNLTTGEIGDALAMEQAIDSIKKHGWKKYPDALLIEKLDHKWSGSSRSAVIPHNGRLRKIAIQRLRKSNAKYDF